MLLRVHIKLAPGSRQSPSEKRSGRVSSGVGELQTGIDARGRRYSIVEVPGTGLSWREYHRGSGLGALVQTVLAMPGLISWILERK
jgi:hypothetical protein